MARGSSAHQTQRRGSDEMSHTGSKESWVEHRPAEDYYHYTDQSLRMGSDPQVRHSRMRAKSVDRRDRSPRQSRNETVDRELEHSLTYALKGAVSNHCDSFW